MSTVASLVSSLAIFTVTVAVGAVSRLTSNVSVVSSSLVDTAVSDTFSPAVSSSRMVSVTAAGVTVPPPEDVADTVTFFSSGPSMSLSAAVMVTDCSAGAAAAVLEVWPIGIVSVVAFSMKSPDTAGLTAAADTVTVTAAAAGFSSVAVTVDTLLAGAPCAAWSLSSIAIGVSTSVGAMLVSSVSTQTFSVRSRK